MSKKMIPLHVADQAVAACEAEIQKLREENAALKAEVERLRDGVETMTYHAPGVETTAWVRAVEYDRLKAEVERLTNAGDAMAKLMFIDKDYIGSPKQEAVVEWCKATEGKQP